MKRATLEVDEYTIHLYQMDELMDVDLREARHRGIPLVGPYSYRKDGPHTPPPVGQHHVHVFKKGNQLFSLNMDGTAHDQSHGVTIPNKVADALRRALPAIIIPTNNLIESDDGLFERLDWLTSLGD